MLWLGVPVQAREQGRLLRPVVKGQNAGAFQHQIIRLHRMLQPRHFRFRLLSAPSRSMSARL